MKLTKKQTKALDFLEDKITEEVLYGGAAGGGKSALGCYWQIKNRLKYPGTRGLIGRSELKNIKKTTLNTFFEIASMQGLRANVHYKYNAQDSIITFLNGSQIILADLFAYPSDPEFDGLGSLEITDAFIDECGQVTEKAKNIVKSRIRYKITEYGLIPKLFMSCNPVKTWPYAEFYKPSREGKLKDFRQFISALPYDNPHLPQSYIDSLKNLDKNSKERLLEGNWEYDDDPATLISYDKILNCFSNDFDSLRGERFITADIARLGSDKVVIGIWDGFRVRLESFGKERLNITGQFIEDIRKRFEIPIGNVLCDEDGVGGGIVDFMNYKGFVNNSSPLVNQITMKPENYSNLKSQCYFELAKRINADGIFIDSEDINIKAQIIQELEQVKQYNMDKDGKKQIMPKDKVKEAIGRSPDFADMLMMREYFELMPRFVVGVY